MNQTSMLQIVANGNAFVTYIVFYLCIVIHLYPIISPPPPPPPPHLVVEILSSSRAKQSHKRVTSNLEENPTSAESDSTDIEIQQAFVGKQRRSQ